MSDAADMNPLFDGASKGPDQYIQFNHLHQTKSTFIAQVVLITLITVILFSVFVAAFYFTFAAQVEHEVVSGSVQSFVAGLAGDLKVVLPPQQAVQLGDLLQSTTLPDLQQEDEEVRIFNKKLTKKTFIVLGILAAIVLIVIFATYGGLKLHAIHKLGRGKAVRGIAYPDLPRLFQIAAITFVGVVAAEFVFLYVIAKQYQPLDPNAIKKRIVDAMIQNLQKMNS